MNIAEKLKEIRPTLSPSSVKIYTTTLTKLSEAVNKTRTPDNFNFLKNSTEIIKAIGDKVTSTKRNYLNAVIVALQGFPDWENMEAFVDYSDLRDSLNKEIRDQSVTGKKTEKQEKNWITQEQYDDIVTDYENRLKKHRVLQSKPSDISPSERKLLQEYLLLKLYKEIPSRNDFARIKIVKQSEYNKLKNSDMEENYLVMNRDGMYFIINLWKTKKSKGDRRRVEVPPNLVKLIRAVIRKKDNPEYLFEDAKGQPLSRNSLTKLFNRIFATYFPDKKISTSMLRHLFLTTKYGDIKNEMEKDSNNLGHSLNTQKDYIKNK
tara:strand:- start:2196 stop:3155 length:960 start_codon:yes stop_codon:yes gene_type:complete